MSGDVVLVAGRDPLSEPGGGHSGYLRAHARAALAAGFQPHLFCVAPAPGLVETDFGVIHRVATPVRPFRQLMVAGHAPRLATAIEAFVATRKTPMVLHGFGVWGYASVLAHERLARRGVAAVPVLSSYTTYTAEARSVRQASAAYAVLMRLSLTAQEMWIRLAVERFERRAYLGARLVLVNYESVRRLIADRFGAGVVCRKVPYASESAFLRDGAPPGPPPPRILATLVDGGQARQSDPPVVLTVAAHKPRKGGRVLLHALARLRARGIPFRACLAGQGPLLEEHRRLAGRLGLGGEVILPGLVPDAYGLIQHADVFVLASLAEQSGSLALLEALQAGRAIVASGVDGILEDVADGHDAILVPPGDAARLADGRARALTDEPLRHRLGIHARQTFEARFSAERFTTSLGATYHELQATAPSQPTASPALPVSSRDARR